jgi:hypothetical protein
MSIFGTMRPKLIAKMMMIAGGADRKDKPAFCEVLAALDCICWG